MKLWPQSLGGQLFVLILLGLLATNLTVQYLSGKGAGTIHRLGLDLALKRYVSDHRVVAACTLACDRKIILAALDASDAHFELHAEPPRHHMVETERDIAARIEALMADTRGSQPHVAFSDLNEGLVTRMPHLVISSRLPDGQWLVGTLQPVVRSGWWRPVGYAIFASGLPVLFVLAVFLRRMLRPLRTLADAAERFSRGERIGPLPESGPRELCELSSAFNQMQARLTRFVDDRTRMVAAISHDFRTPITSLRLRAELIDDADLRSAMVRTLDEMRGMVEETLQFAHDDSHQEKTRLLDLVPVLRHLVHEQQVLGRNVSCELPESFPYRCRPLALIRALQNLLNNALTYGGLAHIRLEVSNSGVAIYVEDDGPGVPEEWLEKAFEPFSRPDHSRSAGGAGLGLSIARSSIEAHGGQIRLTNRTTGGLRATISLPPD